jgi:hypothetical protein
MKKTVIALLVYLFFFTVLFFLAMRSYNQQVSLIPLGFGAAKSDLIVMILSFLGILKTTIHILLLGKKHRFSLK